MLKLRIAIKHIEEVDMHLCVGCFELAFDLSEVYQRVIDCNDEYPQCLYNHGAGVEIQSTLVV